MIRSVLADRATRPSATVQESIRTYATPPEPRDPLVLACELLACAARYEAAVPVLKAVLHRARQARRMERRAPVDRRRELDQRVEDAGDDLQAARRAAEGARRWAEELLARIHL